MQGTFLGLLKPKEVTEREHRRHPPAITKHNDVNSILHMHEANLLRHQVLQSTCYRTNPKEVEEAPQLKNACACTAPQRHRAHLTVIRTKQGRQHQHPSNVELSAKNSSANAGSTVPIFKRNARRTVNRHSAPPSNSTDT